MQTHQHLEDSVLPVIFNHMIFVSTSQKRVEYVRRCIDLYAAAASNQKTVNINTH